MPTLTIKNINHIALHVADVEKSVAFYKNILLLEQISRPGFDFAGAWFRIGNIQELHLIEGLTENVNSGSRSNHFAVETDNLHEWEKHFNDHQIIFRPTKQRPDGAWQLFVQDPDAYWIELCQPV